MGVNWALCDRGGGSLNDLDTGESVSRHFLNREPGVLSLLVRFDQLVLTMLASFRLFSSKSNPLAL